MYKNILVPVDDSKTSNLAIQEAIKLAKVHKSSIRIIHVVDEFIFTTGEIELDFSAIETAMKKTGLAILDKMEKKVREAHIPVESFLIEITDYSGRVPEKIIEDSQNHHADVIVIGTHGRRGFNRLILGSVAEAVLRLATIPVLLIRGQE